MKQRWSHTPDGNGLVVDGIFYSWGFLAELAHSLQESPADAAPSLDDRVAALGKRLIATEERLTALEKQLDACFRVYDIALDALRQSKNKLDKRTQSLLQDVSLHLVRLNEQEQQLAAHDQSLLEIGRVFTEWLHKHPPEPMPDFPDIVKMPNIEPYRPLAVDYPAAESEPRACDHSAIISKDDGTYCAYCGERLSHRITANLYHKAGEPAEMYCDGRRFVEADDPATETLRQQFVGTTRKGAK